MSETDWIEHDGGPCPVALDAQVVVRFRDGTEEQSEAGVWCANGAAPFAPIGADPDWWRHQSRDPKNNIIAYRVVKP